MLCSSVLQQASNIYVTADFNTLLVHWDPSVSQCDIAYIVEYKLVNLDQCSDVMSYSFHRLATATTNASTSISNLEYYSIYTIKVTVIQNGVELPNTGSQHATGITAQAGNFMYSHLI